MDQPIPTKMSAGHIPGAINMDTKLLVDQERELVYLDPEIIKKGNIKRRSRTI